MLVEISDNVFVNPDCISGAHMFSGYLSLDMTNGNIIKTKFKSNDEFTDAYLEKGNDDLVKARVIIQNSLDEEGA